MIKMQISFTIDIIFPSQTKKMILFKILFKILMNSWIFPCFYVNNVNLACYHLILWIFVIVINNLSSVAREFLKER